MTTAISTAALGELKAGARATWSAGDYDAVAEGIWEVGARIVRRVGVRPGEEVLDVAAGTGNAATRAALAGGKVTALDLTPELFEAGRRRAEAAGVDIEWIEGDAEELPFANASFDVVLSTFGVMFAPRQEVAARELVRVLRPGGRVGLATWTPDGTVADMFRATAAALPPRPEIAASPLAWGDPDHVRQLFAGAGLDMTFERERLPIDPDVSPDEAADFYLASFGPLVMARRVLEPEGRWPAFARELRPLLERLVQEPATFLAMSARKTTA